jgi:hypothetical protein
MIRAAFVVHTFTETQQMGQYVVKTPYIGVYMHKRVYIDITKGGMLVAV